MKKKKSVIFSIIGMVVLFGGIIAGSLLVKRNQDFRERAAPATVLRLTSTSQSVAPGESFNLDVLMDTGENSATGVDVIVNFDANNFSVSSVQKGAGISNLSNELRNNYDNNTGTVTYSAYTLDSSSAVNGSGIAVLRITLLAKDTSTAGSYPFTFGNATAVAGTGEGQNVLIDTVPVSVAITSGGVGGGGDQQTVQQTATPTPTSSSDTQNQSTATPTSASSPTPTPSTSPNGTMSPTPFPIPETGVGSSTIITLGLGLFAILLAAKLLAF